MREIFLTTKCMIEENLSLFFAKIFLHVADYHYTLVITLHGLPNPLTGNFPSQVSPYLIVFEGEPNISERILFKKKHILLLKVRFSRFSCFYI